MSKKGSVIKINISLDDIRKIFAPEEWLEDKKELVDWIIRKKDIGGPVLREIILEELSVGDAVSKGEGMVKVERGARLSSRPLPLQEKDWNIISDKSKTDKSKLYLEEEVVFKALFNEKIKELKNQYKHVLGTSKLLTFIYDKHIKNEITDIPEGKELEEAIAKIFESHVMEYLHCLEHAISKNEIYKACCLCMGIGKTINLLTMLEYNERVRQTTTRDFNAKKEAILKKKSRKYTEEEVCNFCINARDEFIKRRGITRGASAHAYRLTSKEFAIKKSTIIKYLNAMKTSRQDPFYSSNNM